MTKTTEIIRLLTQHPGLTFKEINEHIAGSIYGILCSLLDQGRIMRKGASGLYRYYVAEKENCDQKEPTQGELIIDNIKALCGLKKDTDVAAVLGMGTSSVSHMRRGDVRFSPRMFLFLCIDRDMRPSQMFMELGLPSDFFRKK